MELSPAVLTNSYNQFSLDVYRQVASSTSSNVFLCTFSILSALSMCLPGARKNTERQLKHLLNFQNNSNQDVYESNLELLNHFSTNNLKGNVTLTIANRIYPRNGLSLNKEFTDLLGHYFRSEVQSLDYTNPQQSSQIINDWVEQQTYHKIKNLIPASLLTASTQMVLVNAIYFKGDWLKKFNVAATKKQNFSLLNGQKVDVDMMYAVSRLKHTANPNGLKASICEFPYAGEQISMTVVLPDEGVHINEVEAQLANHEFLKNILESNYQAKKVEVILPKFNLSETVELSDVLARMGASDAFSGRADFSGITGSKDIAISKVIHKAIVEVSEEGTVAAGATGVLINRLAIIVEETFEFKCNRPFIFFLHDIAAKNILLIGRYVKP